MRCSINTAPLFYRLMNKWVFFFLLFPYILWGQNLVPNGDFESYSSCPNRLGKLNLADFWFKPQGGSSDYFNACDISNHAGVPNNFFGFQQAYSGSAFIAIAGYALWNQREYASVKLISI